MQLKQVGKRHKTELNKLKKNKNKINMDTAVDATYSSKIHFAEMKNSKKEFVQYVLLPELLDFCRGLAAAAALHLFARYAKLSCLL